MLDGQLSLATHPMSGWMLFLYFFKTSPSFGLKDFCLHYFGKKIGLTNMVSYICGCFLGAVQPTILTRIVGFLSIYY
jgi:hypothetical protein